MSVKGTRTIDNLGVENYVRYAKDQEQIDVRLLQDSKLIPRRIEVSVTKPYIPSEFDKLFSTDRTIHWAMFDAPPEYDTISHALFSHQLIPSLGSAEKQEADIDKLLVMEEKVNKRKKRDENQEEKDEDEERKRILALLKCVENLDKTLTFINARRNQYQRG